MTAITYPRSFPTWFKGMSQCRFQLEYQQELAPDGNGDQIARDLGPTLWKADYRTDILQPDKMGELEAWLDSLENGGQTFWGYDFRRPYPLAYPDGFTGMTRADGGSFDGTCTLGTISDSRLIPLTDLPASFVFSPFDCLAFAYGEDDDSFALHRIMAGVTANGSGAVTVEVRPHVRVGWEAGATVNLAKPSCLMRLVPDSYSPDQQARGKGVISFKAAQTLKGDS